jgi:hypothetical protein
VARADLGELTRSTTDGILMAIGTSSGIEYRTEPSAGIVVLLETGLVERIGVAWGCAMPLLMLCDPGLCASVGVSKPAGASVGACCATPARPMAITPTKKMIADSHLCIIVPTTSKTGLNFLLDSRPRKQQGKALTKC